MPQLLILILAVMVIALVCSALFGLGRWVRRLAGLPLGSWPVTISLGFAVWIFFGGLLNLCHLAYPWALDLIVLAGLTLAAFEWRAAGWQQLKADCWPADRSERAYRLGFYALLLVIMSFMILTQLHSPIYNTGDDLRKYLAHVIRMVQTGTLRGGLLNALGLEALGGQAILQGLIVGHFSIEYVNGADAIFCFGLCLAMAGGVALYRPALGGAALCGLLAVFLIHSQYVNVSSLYSMAALFMALHLLTVDPREHETGLPASGRRTIPTALIYAGVVALKPTGVLFLALQFIFLIVAPAWATRDFRSILKQALATILWSGLFISPWLLLFAPEYIAGWLHPIPPPSTPIPPSYETINLLSPRQKFFGGSYLAYSTVAAGLLTCAAAGFRSRERKRMKLAAICAAAVAAFWLINVPGLSQVESDGALRYSMPILIGVTPAVMGLWALFWDGRTPVGSVNRGACCAIVFVVILFGLFLPATTHRLNLLLKRGTQLPYMQCLSETNANAEFIYQQAVLHGKLSKEVEHWQNKIPPGTKVIAWIQIPFQLDFRRNTIYDANESGLAAAWAGLPEADYVLWQYRGDNVWVPRDYTFQMLQFGRRFGLVMACSLDFYRTLEKLRAQSDIIADEDGFVLMRLRRPPGN